MYKYYIVYMYIILYCIYVTASFDVQNDANIAKSTFCNYVVNVFFGVYVYMYT